jgi:toxin ParE1/3/4
MAKYRLSEAADFDLVQIAQYGDLNFGLAKSNQYQAKLIERFEAIANNPFLYPKADHIRKNYRKSVCGVNTIYYRLDEDGVL